MDTPFTDAYDKSYLRDTMMGPNAMRITEEMASFLPISPGMRILDLGCGMGISSILLAEKYGATVFAADLWIPPTENANRFSSLGLDQKRSGQHGHDCTQPHGEERGRSRSSGDSRIFPLLVDATKEIPFAHGYFDMIISVDAYQYFGSNADMLPKLLPFLKDGGFIAVAVPGFTQDFPEGKLPEEVRPFWTPEWYFYSPAWWRALWEKEPGIEITVVREMDTCKQAWDDWLQSSNPHAQDDLVMMEAGVGKYFNIIQLVGQKI